MIKDYRGYSARVSIDEAQGILHGEVLGILDVVTFQGATVEELVTAFHESVDDYLAYCKQRGEEPAKPYSGRFVLRMPPKLHRSVAVVAKKHDVSMNDWIVAAIERSLESASAAAALPNPVSRSEAQDILRRLAEDRDASDEIGESQPVG